MTRATGTIACGLLCALMPLPVAAADWPQRDDGSIVAWGSNSQGQCVVPAPNMDFVAVSGGCYHALGVGPPIGACCQVTGACIETPGTSCLGDWQGAGTTCAADPCPVPQTDRIVAWGGNDSGQSEVPANTDFVAVAAGSWHTLGLKASGSVMALGWNEHGQCDVPAPNTDFVAVAAGYRHSLGLKADGSIEAWGSNYGWGGGWVGQCVVPEPNEDFVAVAAGWYHNLGLKTDGSIVAWGANGNGQCDVPEPNEDFVAVAVGGEYFGSHNLGLKADGLIVAWGNNDDGQCDVPEPNEDYIVVPEKHRQVRSMTCLPPGEEVCGMRGADLAHPVVRRWLRQVNHLPYTFCG